MPKAAVRMTNFALILNDLTASFEGRNEYIARLCRAPLLILDDFGMERGTKYGLEQVYNVIDSRYRSRRPLIVTTNLSLQDLQHPQDTAHARIYDRLLEMCAPIRFSGENFRRATAQDRRSTQRQEPHPPTTEYRRPAELTQRVDSRLYHRAFFMRRHTLTAFCPLAGQSQTRQKEYIYGIFQ